MAVLGKIEVTVSSGGRVLPEYTVDPDIVETHRAADTPTIVKYIESTPGEEFAINYGILKGQDFGKADYIVLRTYSDGILLTGPVFTRSDYKSKGSLSYTIDGIEYEASDGMPMGKSFLWKELQSTEEAPLEGSEDLEKYAQLGTIRVVVNRGKTRATRPDEKRQKGSLNEEPIPEKALKGQALGATIGLGPERPAKRLEIVRGFGINRRPLAIFVFLYRTKRDLQTLGVIPRTPSPIPLERRDVNTLSLEEARELITRQQAELTLSRQDTETKVKKDPVFKVNTGAASVDADNFSIRGLKREAVDRDEDADNDIVLVHSKKPRVEPKIIDLSD